MRVNLMSFSFNQRVKLSDDVLISDLQGESVILNVNSQRYYGLDKVGSRFLSLLGNSETIGHAFDALLAEYDVTADELRGDLTNLLLELTDQGLVEICD
jgi:Coenzyme PQQ synthesis protein D (PqqD)